MIDLNDYITAEQLAERLGISVRTLKRWNDKGSAPPFKTYKRKRLYHVPTLKRWLQNHESTHSVENQ
jgi:DNA-binding transcriptional MerR regulator